MIVCCGDVGVVACVCAVFVVTYFPHLFAFVECAACFGAHKGVVWLFIFLWE